MNNPIFKGNTEAVIYQLMMENGMIDRYPPTAECGIQYAQKQAAELMCKSPTLGENIDRRIAMMESQIEHLKKVKRQIAEGDWLNVSMDDLRNAMNY
jgi:hypothetical protein